MRRFSYARVALWLAMIPVGQWLGWLESKTFISIISIYALVETAWAAARADDNRDILRRLRRIEELLEEGRNGSDNLDRPPAHRGRTARSRG